MAVKAIVAWCTGKANEPARGDEIVGEFAELLPAVPRVGDELHFDMRRGPGQDGLERVRGVVESIAWMLTDHPEFTRYEGVTVAAGEPYVEISVENVKGDDD